MDGKRFGEIYRDPKVSSATAISEVLLNFRLDHGATPTAVKAKIKFTNRRKFCV